MNATKTTKTAPVPSLGEIYQLTAVPDERVLFRSVNWSFYERLVDSIPESSNIHVDYDGKDLEITSKGIRRARFDSMLARLVNTVAEVFEIPYRSSGQTTWKRRDISRGIEADDSYYFLPGKIAADNEALGRDSDDIADYPNPDLAIEVDITPPRVDRAGIYAAMQVAEVWRFDGREVVIERLTPEKTYGPVRTSQFLPIGAAEIRRWIVDEKSNDDTAWARRLRAEIRSKYAS